MIISSQNERNTLTTLNSMNAEVGRIQDDTSRTIDVLARVAVAGAGTVEVLDFTDSKLYIHAIGYSMSSPLVAPASFKVLYDPDVGSDINLLDVIMDINGVDNDLRLFPKPIYINDVGDIDWNSVAVMSGVITIYGIIVA